MASELTIDKISYNGKQYEFADQVARNGVNSLNTRVTNLNQQQTQAVADEKTRAENAEAAINAAMVPKEEGKGLSTNDFSNEYKGLLDNPPAMTGATSSAAGSQGDVPAPAAGDQAKYLDGSGSWSVPHDTTYNDATQRTHGLMSTSDKIKLDGMDAEPDEVQASNIVFTANTVTETLGNGKVKTTTFNQNGSITQTIVKGQNTITLNTVFNNDGSITRTRS